MVALGTKIRCWSLGLVLVMGCWTTDRGIKPPTHPEEFILPPTGDPRFASPPELPKEATRENGLRKNVSGPVGPGPMGPTSPGANIGPGMRSR